MGNKYKYNAFISYRHISPDKEIADKLQKKLENYKPSRSLSNGKRSGGLRVFRDKTELPTSSNLSNDIKMALENSEYLIVICSKATSESRWCMEEIEYFKQLHNGNNSNIITLVADGDPEDVFPPALCNELIPVTDEFGNTTYQNHVIEPLAANVSGKSLKESQKKLNTEFLRIAAPILGCGYDNLYNREHKKKIRRIFTIGGIVLSLLLLFAVYNSAMLWEINNQKIALAAANEDLQKKTEELNLSNDNLRKSNDDLAKKTKEAEENLVEANKQKKAAEDNLAEAEKQRKIAEQNLAEANRQKKIAEENAKEAARQQTMAEESEKEANKQRGIAEENMRVAQENESKANEANRNLRIKNSEILANQAQMYLKNDDITAATKTALESLALSEENLSSNAVAENALINATGAYSHAERMLSKIVKLSGYVKFLEFSSDGTHILAADSNGVIYIINYQTGNIIKTYTPLETFGVTSSGYNIDDICVDENTGFVLCKEQLISINLTDGAINWHYNKDHNSYVYSNKLVTNTDSESIVLSGGSYPIAISKNTGTISSSFDKNNDNSYGSWNDYSYLSSDDKLYVADTGLKNITIYNINDNSKRQYSLEIPDNCDILSMGENANSIFLNIQTTDNFEKTDNALLICFDKRDMSIKWNTSYEGDYISPYSFNKIFEFTHRTKNDVEEYYETTGIVVVSGVNVLVFDRETGNNYFKTAEIYENEILYCEPNDKFSIKIANSQMIALQTFLVNGDDSDGAIFTEDTLWYVDQNYNFDKKRKYITYAEGNKFALASENSSEISIYHGYKDSNYSLLNEIPEIEYLTFDQCIDNGNGIFAGYHYTYKDKRQDYIMLYDINTDKLLTYKQLSRDVKQMCFIDQNTLFTVDKNGYATALNMSGSIIAEGDIHTLIRQTIGIPEKTYLNALELHLSPTKNGILYCIADGIFEITISHNAFDVNKILYNKNLGEYCISKNFVSFIKENYTNDVCKIVYFKNGDSEISYAQENGIDATFKKDSISSVINNENFEIAFISKEGYIGFYRYGEDKTSKISLPQGEVAPLKILFSPDSKYIIAMCSNGDFVKYSIETLQEVDRYKSTLVINSSSEFEFVDETTFIAKKYKNSTDIILVDIRTMDLKAEIKDFVYFMMKDKKILFSRYVDNKKVFAYYNYLSQKELVDFANNFLIKMGV